MDLGHCVSPLSCQVETALRMSIDRDTLKCMHWISMILRNGLRACLAVARISSRQPELNPVGRLVHERLGKLRLSTPGALRHSASWAQWDSARGVRLQISQSAHSVRFQVAPICPCGIPTLDFIDTPYPSLPHFTITVKAEHPLQPIQTFPALSIHRAVAHAPEPP